MSFETIVLDCIVTAVISACIKKNTSKLLNFCVAILILKMEESILVYYASIISKKVKMQLKCKKRFVRCMEKVLWLTKRVESGLWSSILEMSVWTMLHGQVDQLKLIAIKSRHREQSTLYHGGENRHTQNIQISSYWWKGKMRLLLYGKKLNRLFSQPSS